MSSTNLSLLKTSSLPQYNGVYNILQRGHIGAWADADELYSKIRSQDIATEITTLLGRSPSPATKERVKDLMDEMNSIVYNSTKSLLADMTDRVSQWQAPKHPVATKPPQKVKSNAKNSFAAFLDDDE